MSATAIKLIGIISMTVDHTGFFLFPHNIIFRIIGRLAYPIFAAMIAEGCRYTRNRSRYCLVMLAIACVCSAAAYIAEGTLRQTIFTTFSCAIMLIFALDNAVKGRGQTRGAMRPPCWSCSILRFSGSA